MSTDLGILLRMQQARELLGQQTDNVRVPRRQSQVHALPSREELLQSP